MLTFLKSNYDRYFAIIVAISTMFQGIQLVHAETHIMHNVFRCSEYEKKQIQDGWKDATLMASYALVVLKGTNFDRDELVVKYFGQITEDNRSKVITLFENLSRSGDSPDAEEFAWSCGSWKNGDPSTGIAKQHKLPKNMCLLRDLAAYVHSGIVDIDGQTTGFSSNDIAFCPPTFHVSKKASFLAWVNMDITEKQAFCDETLFSEEMLALERDTKIPQALSRLFRGHHVGHELVHTQKVNVGTGIKAKGDPTKLKPEIAAIEFPAPLDLAYGHVGCTELALEDAAKTIMNADSYANFAWEVTFRALCNKRASSALIDIPDVDMASVSELDQEMASPKPPSVKMDSPKPPSAKMDSPTPPSVKMDSPKPPSVKMDSPKPPSVDMDPPTPPSVKMGSPKRRRRSLVRRDKTKPKKQDPKLTGKKTNKSRVTKIPLANVDQARLKKFIKSVSMKINRKQRKCKPPSFMIGKKCISLVPLSAQTQGGSSSKPAANSKKKTNQVAGGGKKENQVAGDAKKKAKQQSKRSVRGR